MMTAEQAVFAAILVCLAGALLTVPAAKNRTLAGVLGFLAAALSASLVFYAVWRVLTLGPSSEPAAFWSRPEIGFAVRLHVDGLTALFLLLAAFIAVPAALYSIPYMKRYADYSAARYYRSFLVFLAAMYGLLSTTDMIWFFFIFWQMMTLPGWALIRFE